MQVTLEDLEGLERKLNISIPSERIESEVKSKLQQLSTKAKIPGFRPGKIPFDIIKKNYGQSARADVLDNLIRETYPEAIQKENLRPVAPPAINVISADPDGHFVYSATFEIYPEVKLIDFEQIELDRSTSEIKESDIDEMLEKMRKSQAEWEEVTDTARKAQDGDQLTVDFSVLPEDAKEEPKLEKDVKFTLGDGYMWKEFEEPLYGAIPGEEKSFTLDMPDTHMDKNLAGKKVNFNVNVNKLHSPILPELDDAFAEKMKIEGGIVKLKEEVKKQMERELERALKDSFKNAVMEKLIEHHVIDVPKILVEQELDRLAENWSKQQGHGQMPMDKSAFPRGEFREQARKNIVLALLLSTIVKEHDIKVSQDEICKKIEEMLSSYNDTGEMLQKCMSDERYVREIESLLLEEKVVDHLATKMKVLEKVMGYKEVVERK